MIVSDVARVGTEAKVAGEEWNFPINNLHIYYY